MDKALGALHNLEVVTDQATTLKKDQCMKAIGDMAFCNCIAENSPVAVDFIQYVAVVTRTKEDVKYEQLSADDKKIFDSSRAARDECVNWKGKGDKPKSVP